MAIEQTSFGRRAHTKLEQPAAEPVAALDAIEQPVLDQLPRESVHRGLVQFSTTNQFDEGHNVVVGTEGAQDGHRLAEHRVEVRER